METTPKKEYSSKVLMGQWFEKNCSNEFKLAMYLKKKDRKDLLIIRLRRLFDNFLRPVIPAVMLKGLTYGGPYQIFCTHF